MRWLYFIIPLAGLAILITSLSLVYEQRLTLKEALELYKVYINVSPADEAYGLCESIDILNHEYLLHAIKDVDRQLAYLEALKKHDPSIALDSKDISSGLTITPHQAY